MSDKKDTKPTKPERPDRGDDQFEQPDVTDKPSTDPPNPVETDRTWQDTCQEVDDIKQGEKGWRPDKDQYR